jgi:hypothetical protein
VTTTGWSPLMYAVGDNSLECGRILLDPGAWHNDSYKSSVWSSPRRSIFMAISQVNVNMMTMLLDQCDIEVIVACVFVRVFEQWTLCRFWTMRSGWHCGNASVSNLCASYCCTLTCGRSCVSGVRVHPCQNRLSFICQMLFDRGVHVAAQVTGVMRMLVNFDPNGVPACCDEWRKVKST